MQGFFNYSTLEVVLLKKTRTLAIYLNRPEECNAINLEMLFELESILSWCTGRVEIQSILIASRNHYFSKGIDAEHLPKMETSQVEKLTLKLQKITNALIHLPQTVVMDLGDECHNLASELAIGADIRMASVNLNFSFNHTKLGLVPCSGGIGLLSSVVGNAFARNWILSGMCVSRNALYGSGLICEFYDSSNRLEVTHKILHSIYTQASVPRIQSKFGLFQYLAESSTESSKFETQVAKAALVSSDWKKTDRDFKNARELKNERVFKLPKRDPENSL